MLDRCPKLLEDYYGCNTGRGVQVYVRASHIVKVGHRARTNFQEVVALRSVAGMVSFPHLYSPPGSQNWLARARGAPPRPPPSHLWDSFVEISNTRLLSLLHPKQWLCRRQTQALDHSPHSHRPSTSPPSRILLPRIPLTTTLPLIPRP